MLRRILLLAIAACLGGTPQLVEAATAVSEANVAGPIYRAFLDGWTGNGKSPINVSLKANAPSPGDLKQFADCTGHAHWIGTGTVSDISSLLTGLAYVRLVDPDTWAPRDPGDAIAKGEAVDSAVRSGFDQGLLTFSAIAFDESHQFAAFTYSFVCGRLCGNGGSVIFKAAPGGWARTHKQCGGWISQVQTGRPNKPNLLRRWA